MMIGTHLEYCLSDIMSGDVHTDDVYVIVADGGINWDSTEVAAHWWDRQMDPWSNHLTQGKNSLNTYTFEEVYMRIHTLIDQGKLASRGDVFPGAISDIVSLTVKSHWYEMITPRKDMEPAVKLAWEHYQMLAGLCK